MNKRMLSRRSWLQWSGTMGIALAGVPKCVAGACGRLDGNLQIVDLTDLVGDLPLEVQTTNKILRQTEDWEHTTWKNPHWPAGGGDNVGYPSVVKNTHGVNPDGKYYLYYAHHDPRSGIGVAIADKITGPYSKSVHVPGRSDNQVVPSFHADSRSPGDPAHNSSPWVVWNERKQLWFLYFHFFNHAHGATTDYQMTALATTPELGSHRWTIWASKSARTLPRWVPVLPTTKQPWANQASSYNAVYRLPDGRFLAFVRGTSDNGKPPQLGFAMSDDGRRFEYFEQNPIIYPETSGGDRKGVYRVGFVGYLGKKEGKDRFLVAWQESRHFDGDLRVVYGYTTDFKTIERDERGYARWRGGDGAICARREGDRLYLFAGKLVHEMKLPV